MIVRQSAGSHLVRNDKIALDAELLQAAKESVITGDAMEAVFDTEKAAKAVATKLRSYLNENGQGLRAKVVEDPDTGEWVLEFRVSATKRDISTSA
jgi:hypothetical protein